MVPWACYRFSSSIGKSTDQECQLQVLTKPKNALGKQYKKTFDLNNVSNLFISCSSFFICSEAGLSIKLYHIALQVKLHFTDAALRLIAKKAMAKNIGSRGLRAILENVLTEAMYEVRWISTGHNYPFV